MNAILALSLLVLLWLSSMATILAEPLPFDSEAIPCGQIISLVKTRPQAENIPLQINLNVDVLDISEIDETEQSTTLDLLLQLRWQDPRLKPVMNNLNVDYCLGNSEKIWHPYLGILNSTNMQKKLEDFVYIKPDGTITYNQFLKGIVESPFDLRKFPFDQQIIPIKIIFFDPKITQSIVSGIIHESNKNLSITNWSLLTVTNQINWVSFGESDLKFKSFEYDVNIKRHLGFPLWKMIFPVSLITFMPYLVFWLRPTLIMPQITLSVVTIISIIAFQSNLSSAIPHISYLTGADKFVIGSMLMIFLALIQTIIGLNLSESNNDDLAISLDFWMRVFYPILFLILIILAFFV